MTRELELGHRAAADASIAEAERVISEQRARVEKLRRDDQDTHLAEETLRAFEAHLQMMRDHRDRASLTGDGAHLVEVLGLLVDTAIDRSHGKARAAFYLANDKRTTLHHAVGMTTAYAACVDGFAIGPHSLACGLAAATRHPVITQDVMADESWSKWRWLATAFGYRGCWSFPIETRDGNIVGTFAMYHKEPIEPKARDFDLATVLTCAAAQFIGKRTTVAG